MEEAAPSLVSNAVQLLNKEYQLLSGVSGDVGELRNDLSTMNALLRMQSEADEGAVDHFVREWMKQLRELAYDSEDSIDLYRLRIKSRANDAMLPWLKRLVWTLWPRRCLASEIRGLRARATAIGERHARYYGINREALRGSASSAPSAMLVASGLSAQSLRHADDPEHNQVVAMEEQADTVAKQMKASVEKDQCLKVFFIVGSNGDDRARLAEEVCRRLGAEFPFQVTVKVSQRIEPVLKHVLEQVVKFKKDEGKAIEGARTLDDTIEDLDGVNHLAKELEASLEDKSAKQHVPIFSDASQGTMPVLKEVIKPKKDKGKAIEGERALGDNMDDLDVNHLAEQPVASLNDKSAKQRVPIFSDASQGIKPVLEQVVKPKKDKGKAIEGERALGDNLGDLDVNHLAEQLVASLNDKRYLIVIADVTSIKAWDAIRSKLPDNQKSSRIIVSTPTEAAINAIGDDDIYRMKALRLRDERNLLVGVKEQASSLVKILKKEDDGLRKVFSIVGFGGLGKTTLAMEVCRQLEADFPIQAMVSVSQAFEPTRDLKPLLKRVLQQVVKPRVGNEKGIKEEGNLPQIDGWSEIQLAKELEDRLKQDKRHLIVIDDVWTVRAWEAIQSKLPNINLGGRVIVTTRLKNVAKACSTTGVSEEYIYHIKPLELEDSRKLFLSRAFGSMDAKCPNDLKEAMESILRKCGGLPLAIVSIASVLAGYTSSGSKGKWETICRSIGSQMESHPTLEGMSQILTLSYNHLPHELKACMMYLSIFPEDYSIRKDRLLHRWIAEGLITEKRGLTMLEVAESYYEELLSRNMIFVVQVSRDWHDSTQPFDYDGKLEWCQVHDMLLEVMVSKSLEANFVSLVGGQYGGMSYERIRRLSIHEGVDSKFMQNEGQLDSTRKKKMADGRGSMSRSIVEMNLQQVRSLSVFQLHGNKLLDQLGKFTLLRVLDLEGCEGVENKHVRYACQLYLLKFLSLRNTYISEVPHQINNLEHLQTLDVRGTLLEGLPATMTELEKLEHIRFVCQSISHMWLLPEGLSRMKALREVGFALLNHDNSKVAREVGKLEQLQELAIGVDSSMISNAEDFHEELAKSLSKLYSLRSLNIRSSATGDTVGLKFLSRLREPPRLLRHLCVHGPIGCQLPTWVGSLTYLVEIVLVDVQLCDDEPFSVLCKLPSLQSIKMIFEYYTGEELVAHTGHNSFLALINLEMHCHRTPQVYRFEAGSMPKLEKLKLFFFSGDYSIVGIEHLTNLKEAHLSGEKDNDALNRAVEQLKAESGRREGCSQLCSQLQVIVKYWE